jgi:hypothetical protein
LKWLCSLAVCLLSAVLATPAAVSGPVLPFLTTAPAPPKRPKQRVPFPPIADWSSLRITLERTPCYGTCPGYSVEIAGDGTVTYIGQHFVAESGVRTAKIPQSAVRALYEAFVKAEFFWSFDEYRAPVTDLPTKLISISYDGHSKAVLDYAGERAGMPKAIAELEMAIDAAAGTAKWIRYPDKP